MVEVNSLTQADLVIGTLRNKIYRQKELTPSESEVVLNQLEEVRKFLKKLMQKGTKQEKERAENLDAMAIDLIAKT